MNRARHLAPSGLRVARPFWAAAALPLAAALAACSGPTDSGPDDGIVPSDSAAALEAAANAFADSPELRAYGAYFDAIPTLPREQAYSLIRSIRTNQPPAQVRARAAVLDTAVGGVPVSWIDRSRRASGLIVYVHGGGYIAGPGPDEWIWITELASRTSSAAVGIVYRMPPDAPFPAAFNDAVAAVMAMSRAGDLPANRWILAGGSAGGGLAVATMRALLDQGVTRPAGLLLEAPWVDIAMTNPDLAASDAADPVLSRGWLGWAAELYANGTRLDDPRLSPVNASFSGFPATLLDVGTRDMFLPDVRRIRDRLRSAGAQLEYIEQPGAVHTYSQNLTRPEGQVGVAKIVKWLNGRFGR
jgi:acetyl esterase/lipase